MGSQRVGQNGVIFTFKVNKIECIVKGKSSQINKRAQILDFKCKDVNVDIINMFNELKEIIFENERKAKLKSSVTELKYSICRLNILEIDNLKHL